MEIRKAILPAAGLGTRFLPITKAVPKELLPLVDLPMISYVLREAKESEIEQVVFVISERKKAIADYFKKSPWLENILEKRKKEGLLQELKRSEKEFRGVSLSFVLQQHPLGDGDAVFRAKKLIGKEPCGILFADDIFQYKKPVLEQLIRIFKACQKPVIGLKKVSQEKLSPYGVVGVEKIAHRLYKIKDLVEKPKDASQAPSDLVIAGRYIITSEVFDYLKEARPNEKGEIILADVLRTMIEDGKIIYGYEIDGQWLECGNKIEWLKSNFYFCLHHPEYGPVLKEWLKKMK